MTNETMWEDQKRKEQALLQLRGVQSGQELCQAYRCPECGEVWTGKHKDSCSQPGGIARLATNSRPDYGAGLQNAIRSDKP